MANGSERARLARSERSNAIAGVSLTCAQGHYLHIVPDAGGMVNELVFQTPRGPLSVIAGFNRHDDIKNDKEYRNIPLFPLVNRLDSGCYQHLGHTYQFPINEPEHDNALHGFVQHLRPQISRTSPKGKEHLTLSYDYDGDRSYFPFPCRFEMTYFFSNSGELCLQLAVINQHVSSIPVSYGWHPYFCLNSEVIDDLSLQLPSREKYQLDSRMLTNGEYGVDARFATLTALRDIQLDDCFRLSQDPGCQHTLLWSVSRQQGIRITQTTGARQLNYLQVCTARDRQSIAIEPVSAPPNAWSHGQGRMMLEPQERIDSTIMITVQNHTE